MPRITTKTIGVELDVFGCPNRCRHCWLGYGSNRPMSVDDLRWTAQQFRDYIKSPDSRLERLTVSSDFREPDYSDNYRQLHQLCADLSDGKPARYELLSIWRLAHDHDYVNWAKSVGPDTCQISFFGMEETNDWFYRRKGAFNDALTATERLLEGGMKPRWQIFLTKKLLPELDDLLHLIEHLKLRERVQELGGEFQLFMHPPGPDGEGRKIEYLRCTAEEVAALPEEILAPSKKHLGKVILWRTEREFCELIVKDDKKQPDNEKLLGEVSQFWFLIKNNWDVYSNVGTLEPWWRLGNLKTDSVQTIIQRFERDEIPGLDVLLHFPKSELVKQYANPDGSKIYSGSVDLLSLYQSKHCEKNWNQQ
jgi:hypothetical protein